VFGENALLVARQFYKTQAVVKYLGGSEAGLPYVSLNRALFETVLRELLLERAEHTVEVYEGSGATWRLSKSGSPGRLGPLEEDLFRTAEMSDVPVVAAVQVAYVEGTRMVRGETRRAVAFCPMKYILLVRLIFFLSSVHS
jgi:DNA mismatch repair protein MSH2